MSRHRAPRPRPPRRAARRGKAPPTGPLAGQSIDDLARLLESLGEPAYRARQVFRAVWRQHALDPRAITTLPMALRERLAETLEPAATETLEVQASEDGTHKYLFGLADGKRVEAVMIPERDRRTVCVSSQVGCPVGCVFCASGVRGLVRNLSAAEVAEQLLRVTADLGERPSNVVMMGMGEPLLNLPAVADAIRQWTDPEGLGLSPRRITVSTALTPAAIERLADERLGVNLAVSLHAPDDETRAALVPRSPGGRVEGLVDAATRFVRQTGRDATLEYVLIQGENDQPEHAEVLADLVAGRPLHVNLIPLNPIPHRPDLRPPSGLAARAFARRLAERGGSVTLRSQRGEDIDAACGQLALERTAAGA